MIEELIQEVSSLPQAPCNVRHIFAPGLYIRELTMPAGVLAIGRRHREAHLNVMIKGILRVLNPDGSCSELNAPQTFVSPPGRKVGYIVEEIVWLNIYPTQETDIDTLEEMLFEDGETLARLRQGLPVSDNDYPKMLEELNVEESTIRQASESESDLIPFPLGVYRVKIGPSRIEGKGVLATSDIASGEMICPARLQGRRTPAGRYTNHSGTPNAIMVEIDGDIYLQALSSISGCRGGLDGEEITVDYRQSTELRLRMFI